MTTLKPPSFKDNFNNMPVKLIRNRIRGKLRPNSLKNQETLTLSLIRGKVSTINRQPFYRTPKQNTSQKLVKKRRLNEEIRILQKFKYRSQANLRHLKLVALLRRNHQILKYLMQIANKPLKLSCRIHSHQTANLLFNNKNQQQITTKKPLDLEK